MKSVRSRDPNWKFYRSVASHEAMVDFFDQTDETLVNRFVLVREVVGNFNVKLRITGEYRRVTRCREHV